MSMTDTTVGTEIEILESLDWTPTEPCSVDGCTRDAEWYGLCPYDRSAETICTIHKDVWVEDEAPVRFDGTCQHIIPAALVIWEPYK